MEKPNPFHEQEVSFAKHLIYALESTVNSENYDQILEILERYFQTDHGIEIDYLEIHVPFQGDDSELKVWEEKRIRLIKDAADAGVPEAQYELGLLEFEKENFEGSFKLFRDSSRSGYPPALYSTGWAFFFGKGTEKNESKGIECIELAAGQLNVLALEFLINHFKDNEELSKKYGMMLTWA